MQKLVAYFQALKTQRSAVREGETRGKGGGRQRKPTESGKSAWREGEVGTGTD